MVAMAQTRNVSGRVVEATGDPVPFASVNVKGSRTTVAAGPDGNFVIKAKTGDVLVVSAIGFSPVEATVGADNNMVIKATRISTSLTDVVVTTALGIQRQAKSLGYSTAKVSSTELVQAKPISVANGLTGKVSGLQINTVNNGLFAPTRVTLRGNRSLTGNNTPLLVVDGAIYYGDISTLNPEDVGDVTILKGSSASAVYGSDASNGVIIVTTKHGNRGRTNVTFSTTVQGESVSYLPAEQFRFGANGGEAFVEDFNDLSTYQPYENQSYGPEYNGKMVPLGRPAPDNTVYFIPYSPNKNMVRDFFNTGITTQQNLSVQSTEENGSLFFSLQDIVSKAVMPGDKGRRDIFRLGGTKKYGIFSANYSAVYTYKYTNTTNTGSVYNDVLETPNSTPLNKFKNWNSTNPADYFSTPSGFYNDYYQSPWAVIGTQRNYNTENDINANLQLNLKPWKWLNLSYRTAITSINTRYEYKNAGYKYTAYAHNDPRIVFANYDATAFDTVTAFGSKAIAANDALPQYATSSFNNFLFSTDFIASVTTPIAKDFNLNGTVGYSYLDNTIKYSGINTGNLTFPVFNTSIFSNAPSVGNYLYQARKMGLFGEATVDYKSMVYLHGSYRTDIDSRLSRDNRFIPYYDIDGSVVLSDIIPAMKDNKVFNFAKIRVAHSLTGNVSPLAGGSPYIAFGAYATEQAVVPGYGFPYSSSGLSGYGLSTVVANPNIKPEKVTEDEIGLELGFFKDRLMFNGSVYKAVTTDGIVSASISSATGAQQALLNAAKTQNKGIELELKGTVVKTRDLTWNVGVNWTHIESKVLSIAGSVPQLSIPGGNGNAFAVLNSPYPVIQTYDWIRDSASGKVIVDPVTGNPKKATTLTNFGAANPVDVVGITTTLTWKNFTFSATADYRGGHKIFNVMGNTLDHSGIGYTTALTGRQRFIFPNSVVLKDGKYVDNTDVSVDDANFNFWPSLYNSVGANYVVSAAAWKLREVVLTYNFPKNWLSFTKIAKTASLAVSGRNLVMLRPSTNKWTDPEFSEDAGNGVGRTGVGQAPPTRIYSATLSVTF